MRLRRKGVRVAVLSALASFAPACGGAVGASASDAGGPDASAPIEAAAGCAGDRPLCCPQSCAGEITPAACTDSAWTCPVNAVLLDPEGVCDSDCAAPPPDASTDASAPVCPSVYSVYGNTDPSANLGHVDPRLYASGTCRGPTEQLWGIDAGTASEAGPDIASTDLTISLQQSAPGSGMFVTVIHQTTPFSFDLTTCLMSAGLGTGSSPIGTEPGTMALVNDPENKLFPQVQLGTNLAGDDLLFDVSVTVDSSFALNTVNCTFTKN